MSNLDPNFTPPASPADEPADNETAPAATAAPEGLRVVRWTRQTPTGETSSYGLVINTITQGTDPKTGEAADLTDEDGNAAELLEIAWLTETSTVPAGDVESV